MHARATRVRLDQALVDAGLAPSREKAQALILAGRVLVDGTRRDKPGFALPEGACVTVAPGRRPYASRAGEKLAGALDALVLDPSGWRCLDIGASTGGFTDVLLRRGATHVTAVDVGRGLLEATLAADPRVTLLEGMNARHLAPSDVAPPYDLAVLDVSFISLELIVPRVLPLVPAGKVLALVKPQFELDRADVAPGAGVVRDPVLRARAVRRVIRVLMSAGWGIEGIVESSLAGPRGNREVFVLAASGEGWSAEQIEQRILAEVHRGEG